MPRQRITLALLRALVEDSSATDVETMTDSDFDRLIWRSSRTVLAVSHGANGALVSSGCRLYAAVGRTARLQQLI